MLYQAIRLWRSGQIGVRYHLKLSYVGLELSAQENSRQGNVESVDLAGILGTDITPRTHMYGKLGVSYAK